MLADLHIIIKILFLALAGFISAFVDAVAGGGGMISMPAYLAVGFPIHNSLGTNKFSSTSGSLVSTISFAREGKSDREILKFLLPCSFIGAVVGVMSVLALDPDILKPIILVLLLGVGVYSLFSKSMGMEDSFVKASKKSIIVGMLFAFVMGFYDGFFGPGTGSFIIFGLIKIYKFDYVRASGNAKAMNFMSNIASLITFAINGKIFYLMGIPMAIFMMVGAFVGSKFAVRGGAKFVKPIFVTMSLGMALKMLYEMI